MATPCIASAFACVETLGFAVTKPAAKADSYTLFDDLTATPLT